MKTLIIAIASLIGIGLFSTVGFSETKVEGDACLYATSGEVSHDNARIGVQKNSGLPIDKAPSGQPQADDNSMQP